MKEKINPHFKIIKIFEPITWWLLLTSLLLISLVSIKTKGNFTKYFINSLKSDLECLLTKQSKCKFDVKFDIKFDVVQCDFDFS